MVGTDSLLGPVPIGQRRSEAVPQVGVVRPDLDGSPERKHLDVVDATPSNPGEASRGHSNFNVPNPLGSDRSYYPQ